MTNSMHQSLSLTFIFLLFSISSAHNDSHVETNPSCAETNPSHVETNPDLQINFKGSFSKVFAFGDSYTDTGNAHFLGGLNVTFSPGDKSSPENSSPVSNYTNRMCNGRLVLDFLSEALNLPPIPAYKEPSANFNNGVNFAIAGSTVFTGDHFSSKNVSNLIWKGIPMAFQTQMDWFNKYMTEAGCKGGGEGPCKAMMDNALFWLGEMGVVDYGRAQGSSAALQWLREVSVKNVGKLLEMLLERGAKYVVVQGLPPVGCLPLDISLCPLKALDRMGCAAAVNKAVMIHNQILKKKLENLRKAHPNCKIVYADYWNAYLTLLLNAKKYNIEEPFKACCGSGGGKFNFNKKLLCGSPGTSVCKDPSKYMSWDGIHLTEASYKHLADLFLNQGFCSPSFSDLIKGKKII
ncbi:hypothetical protein BUALT_Bualt17G0028000 [Buddleja alternifolia]|uniref:Uncharacterized protein n=1 Tax=Buddleja alternifolia TaxID=168488 RepID=A0AAV6WB65_9LAMI|nr:hypothetical protein BUALT_Bualt17G0028000 [Buddleja alternifolia]